MERSRIATSLAAAALVVLVAIVVASRWDSRTEVTNPGQGTSTPAVASTTAPTSLPLEIATIASSSGIYVIRAEYPRFPTLPGLTAEIDGYVRETVSQFERVAREDHDARRDVGVAEFQYSLDVTWRPAQLNGRYASLLVRVDAFEGGANLRQEVRTFNHDVAQGRTVTLASLFPDDPSYLQRVSAFARQVLESRFGEDANASFLADGTRPTLDNFQWFTFTDDAITFTFPKYQVAPGAAGEQTVTMPRNVSGLY